MTYQEVRERIVTLREQMRDDHEAMSRIHENAGGRELRSSEQEEYDRRDARFQRNQQEVEKLQHEHGISPPTNAAVRAHHAAMAAEGTIRHEVEGDTPRRTRASVTLGREERMADWYRSRPGVRSDYDGSEEDFSLGRAVRGMVSGRWNDAETRRAISAGSRFYP